MDDVVEQWGLERPEIDVSPMQVVGRVSRAAALLDRRIAKRLATFDLQPGEFDVLATLLRSGAPHRLPVGRLTSHTMVTSGAVSHRLNRLEDRGLIQRSTEPTNRRRGRAGRTAAPARRSPPDPKVRGASLSSAGVSSDHLLMAATTPAPTVRPPSRMAKRSFSSMATGTISATSMVTLSPGITISVPSGSVTTPVTSVVRK